MCGPPVRHRRSSRPLQDTHHVEGGPLQKVDRNTFHGHMSNTSRSRPSDPFHGVWGVWEGLLFIEEGYRGLVRALSNPSAMPSKQSKHRPLHGTPRRQRAFALGQASPTLGSGPWGKRYPPSTHGKTTPHRTPSGCARPIDPHNMCLPHERNGGLAERTMWCHRSGSYERRRQRSRGGARIRPRFLAVPGCHKVPGASRCLPHG